MKTITDYWFTIEPYVFVGMTDSYVLLYNTLDGVIIESDKTKVIELLRETIKEENCGVVLLTGERYQQKEVNAFIGELREKYMGDIIDVSLSKGKPVQLLPYFNFPGRQVTGDQFLMTDNILGMLSEISIHVDHTTDIVKLLPYLQSVPEDLTLNIVGNINDVDNRNELLSFFDRLSVKKNIVCSYIDVITLQPAYENNFSYIISVQFPIDIDQWNISLQILQNQTLPFEYSFGVSSLEDCRQVEQLVEQFGIEKYRLNPVYTGDNIRFFEDNVFLTKEDILSATISIKDFFTRQSLNIYDFGKIHIMPTGDMYANINRPILGNISTDSIYEIVHKELQEGKSWLRVRNQAPCNNCVYQWLCPSPSDYEIAIGRPNLCHLK